jgi:2-phosphoglycerate kinase
MATANGCLTGVHWIGGGSGAGKSTVARRLATKLGMPLYDTDLVMDDHIRRVERSTTPFLQRFLEMDTDERWLRREPTEMLDTFHWFRGEGFELIVDDLRALSRRGPVIAEGFRLLPGLVAPLLDEAGSAVWVLPTPAFRRNVFATRGSTQAIVDRTSDPGTALQNLLERDRLFTERLRVEVRHHGLAAIDVDVGTSEHELVERVRSRLALPSSDA